MIQIAIREGSGTGFSKAIANPSQPEPLDHAFKCALRGVHGREARGRNVKNRFERPPRSWVAPA